MYVDTKKKWKVEENPVNSPCQRIAYAQTKNSVFDDRGVHTSKQSNLGRSQ